MRETPVGTVLRNVNTRITPAYAGNTEKEELFKEIQ